MLESESNPVEWALFISELEDAQEHLGDLLSGLVEAGRVDEEVLRVDLGHVYAHLNRAWHARAHVGEIKGDQWPSFSAFPTDIDPVG